MNENILVILSQPNCGPCKRAKEYMEREGIPFKEFNIFENDLALGTLQELGYRSTPVFIAPDGLHWAGVSSEKMDQYK
jgi:glutaredoxin-like protein NrdH